MPKRLLKEMRSKTWDHPSLVRKRIDQEWSAVQGAAKGVKPGNGQHILLAPSGAGNIGDQAMVEAFIENVQGPVVVVVRSEGDVVVPSSVADRVSLLTLPGLTSGAASRTPAEIQQFVSLLDGNLSFSVVGADVLDGAYSYRHSIQRVTLPTFASRLGFDARILGFSWNASPDPRCSAAITEAGRSGVKLLTRDPISAMRLRKADVSGVVDSADLVFAAMTLSSSALREDLGGLTAPFALVNVSGLIGRNLDQLAEYRAIVRSLREHGLEVVILPHVSRAGGDDMVECRRVFEDVTEPGVHMVERLLAPAEVRGLAAAASVTVTGRMHLSIMSLYSGVPAITLATQGKVEGMMRLFELPELTVEPVAGFGANVVTTLARLMEREDEVKQKLRTNLERVKLLAAENFRGISA